MYAIIRAGGKQSKVREGDVIDVERIKLAGDTVTFTPLLIVGDDGTVVSDRGDLEKATVTAEVVGEHRGDKIEVFKYKPKTGYRRRQGHRQTYTTLRVTSIGTGKPGKPKKAANEAGAKKAETAEPVTADEGPAPDGESSEES
jgi:large subunit ribosomal protein L21